MQQTIYSQRNWQKKPRRSIGSFFKEKMKALIRLGIIILVLFVLAGSIAGVFTLAWLNKTLPSPDKIIERTIAQSTKIYDRTGKTILYDIHGDEQRTLAAINDIPKYLQQATIAIEDKDFYKHGGFSLWAIFRSTVTNILRGEKAGGSTLTQQFVKNAILSPEKTYTRKLKELVLAYKIEQKFSKDKILQMYLNEIPYGATAYGVAAASKLYFGKDVRDITLGEAAVLAALPQAPSLYSPYGQRKDLLLTRQNTILDMMAAQGYITKDEAEAAKKEKLVFKDPTNKIIAPHFVMYVKDLLIDQYGERAVAEGGLSIYTTLDLAKQKIAEEAINAFADKNAKNYNANNAALVSLDPKNGQILAMVGSKDYFNKEIDGNVNVSLRPRQPGSSFKPIVYAAAFEKGYTPETILYDVNTTFKTQIKDFIPYDYDMKERGPLTIRQALAGSLNIPAVKTLYLTGVDTVLDWADKLGYTTLSDRSRFGLSLVLGGGEVTLLEHTAAIGSFAQGGMKYPTTSILKVVDKDGKTLEEWKPSEGIQIFSQETTRKINSILSDNDARSFIFGPVNYLTLGDRPVAAKTGTTNDYHDAWTVGYTPSLSAGVWVGNNDNSKMNTRADGSMVAAPIWHEYMQKALAKTPVETFTLPQPNNSAKPILQGINPGTVTVKIDSISGKLATELTPIDDIIEKTYQKAHSILYYVNKDDPAGPPPLHPEEDPQYANWEAGIQAWLAKQGIAQEEPPTEYDDIHTQANQPTINITAPENNKLVEPGTTLAITVNTMAPRGIARVDYSLDDALIVSSNSFPFSININIPFGLSAGAHMLKAQAFDDVENSGTAEISFYIN